MVASTYMRVIDQKVPKMLSIYTVEASNKDQTLVRDISKKEIINYIYGIIIIVILEPLELQLVTLGFSSKQFENETAAKREGKNSRHGKYILT